jgi:hypothetical protein
MEAHETAKTQLAMRAISAKETRHKKTEEEPEAAATKKNKEEKE